MRSRPRHVFELIEDAAGRSADHVALRYATRDLGYEALRRSVEAFGSGLIGRGLKKLDRVAIYAEKRFESVIAMFGASRSGGVYVPINPLLKAEQVAHILNDSQSRVLVTTRDRLDSLSSVLSQCPSVSVVVCMDGVLPVATSSSPALARWEDMMDAPARPGHRLIDRDMAAILYTSGSTGRPKGVVLSHRNILAGAESVSEYLELTDNDRVLCVLPLSFDYGMNQLTTMFLAGGTAVLLNHLFAKDVIAAVHNEKITGLAAVPPLWIQLSRLEWPAEVSGSLRYITNSGGHMPAETLRRLRQALPATRPYLMYGLTESFRSTYLPPEDIDRRPGSIGKAIPNAEILVVRPDGTECSPDEPGELVHRGALVSLGYWNDPAKTAERFKPLPGQDSRLPLTEMCVWSGDKVKRDADGYLYFIGRDDEMIKTSGYRVSPTEIEEFISRTGLILECAAFGIPHPVMGQVIGVVAMASSGGGVGPEDLVKRCQAELPSFMVPAHVEVVAEALPRNSNGKIDRKLLSAQRKDLFAAQMP